MQREEPRNRMSNDTWKMGASPQTPGVLRIGPMGLNAAVRAAPVKDPTSAARRLDARWRNPPLRLLSSRAVSCG